jgi:hypothetical protein
MTKPGILGYRTKLFELNKSHFAMIVSIVTVTLFSAVHLVFPLDGDQSFYLYTVKHMHDGSVLYKDIWDVKQPGIFLFYLTAGKLFGFNETGIHVLEVIWMAIQCGVTIWWASILGISPHLRPLIPVFTVGAYYGAASAWHLTQVEGLAGLPLLLAGGLALAPCSNPRSIKLVAAGAAGGVALVFKAMFFPILLAMWGTVLVLSNKEMNLSSTFRTVAGFAAPLCIGCALPLLAVAFWAAQGGFLPDLLFSTFAFPVKFYLSESHNHFYPLFRTTKSLIHSLSWYIIYFGPILVLAILGVRDIISRKKVCAGVLLSWIVSAISVFLSQTWLAYHLMLLVPPVGILAVSGMEWLVREPYKRRFFVIVSILILVIYFGILTFTKIKPLVSHGIFPQGEARIAFQEDVLPNLRYIMNDCTFLRTSDSLQGPIYVWEQGPRYWVASGRELVQPMGNVFQLPEQRLKWPAAIISAKPAYIRLPRQGRESLNSIDPKFQQFLDVQYEKIEGMPPWYGRVK